MRSGVILPLLLSLSAGSAWGEGASKHGVEIVFVAPDGSDYQQTEAHFRLDGAALAVPDGSSPGQRYLLFAGDLPVGDHRLDVDLQYRRGDASFFSRGTRAMVQVKGSADFQVETGRHLVITGRIQIRTEKGVAVPSFLAGISASAAPPEVPVASQDRVSPPAVHPVSHTGPVSPVPEAVTAVARQPLTPVATPDAPPKPAAAPLTAKPAAGVVPAKAPTVAPKIDPVQVAARQPDEAPGLTQHVKPKPKTKPKRRRQLTAMERLRHHLRTVAGQPAAPPAKPEENPAMARLRALLRKRANAQPTP